MSTLRFLLFGTKGRFLKISSDFIWGVLLVAKLSLVNGVKCLLVQGLDRVVRDYVSLSSSLHHCEVTMIVGGVSA